MADVIQGMLQSALGDGARSTKFEAYINFSTAALGPQNTDIYMHVKTTAFPGKSFEPIDLRFKGRSIPIRGQVKYDNTWSCTFHLTEGHELKLAFENWIESLDQTQNMSANLNSQVRAGQAAGTGFASDFMIAQMDFSGEGQTSVYNLHNVFPKNVSSVQIDYSSVGTILEFTVEFAYSHYTAVQVGGVKLPAKTGAGPDIPGFSELAGANTPNFALGGLGSNIRDLEGQLRGLGLGVRRDLESQLMDSSRKALIDSIDSVSAGDFGNLKNIATNFGGSAQGIVMGTFSNARESLGALSSVSGLQAAGRQLVAINKAPLKETAGAIGSGAVSYASNYLKNLV